MTLPGWLGLGAVSGLLVGYALWGHGKPPVIPAATVAEMAALRADSARFTHDQEAARDSIIVLRDRLGHDSIRVNRLAQSAAASRHVADSLAAVAARFPILTDDSAALYFKDAYQERSREADSLRVANGLAFQSMRGAMATANLCLKSQMEAEGRLSQEHAVNQSLQDVIARSRQPSRFSLGISAGYGATLSSGEIRTGPTVALTVNYALKLPHLF
jgi:hypothetical protein